MILRSQLQTKYSENKQRILIPSVTKNKIIFAAKYTKKAGEILLKS